MAKIIKTHRPNELAPHVAMLFADPAYCMEAVTISMNKAITILKLIEPTNADLTNPNYGIPYALHFESENNGYKDKVKAAGNLLRMCLHAKELGNVTELDKIYIPMKLAELSGYDNSHKNKGIPRKNKTIDLLERLKQVEKYNPTDTCVELLDRLEGNGDIYQYDAAIIEWQDDNGNHKTTNYKTFQNWLSKIKNPK